MRSRKRLLAVLECAHERQDLLAQSLVLLQHLAQIVFEMP